MRNKSQPTSQHFKYQSLLCMLQHACIYVKYKHDCSYTKLIQINTGFHLTTFSSFQLKHRWLYIDVVLQLLSSQCLPSLMYGLESCPLVKSDLLSLDFVVNRFFMKLFKTNYRRC